MSDGMGREFTYLSSHATNRYFIPNWGRISSYRVAGLLPSLPFFTHRKLSYINYQLLLYPSQTVFISIVICYGLNIQQRVSAPSAVHICTDRRPYRCRPPRMARAEPITPELLSFSLLYNANLFQYSENSGEKVLIHFVFSYLFDNFGVNY